MKKKHERAHSVRKERDTPPKPADFRTATDGAGIRRPIQGRIGPDGDPVYPIGSHPRPAPTDPSGRVACGACSHAEKHGAKFVCRSLLSPRAGFAHERKYACGYGRKVELVGA